MKKMLSLDSLGYNFVAGKGNSRKPRTLVAHKDDSTISDTHQQGWSCNKIIAYFGNNISFWYYKLGFKRLTHVFLKYLAAEV